MNRKNEDHLETYSELQNHSHNGIQSKEMVDLEDTKRKWLIPHSTPEIISYSEAKPLKNNVAFIGWT